VNRISTLYLREDQIISQAVAQLGDADRDDIPGLLRARRVTIVCTAASTVLDIPASSSGNSGPTGPIQPAIPDSRSRSSGGDEEPPVTSHQT